MTLRLRGQVQLPPHLGDGGFDHGDVHLPSGRVFVAHTANGTVEVIDGIGLRHLATIDDCAEASGVLCSPDGAVVIAAARGAGHILVIDPTSIEVRRKIPVGGRPNGLAWDSLRQRVLVADVAGNSVSVVEPSTGRVLRTRELPGRPRWAAYEPTGDRYLVNVRTPAIVAVVDPESAEIVGTWPVSSAGPHGLDIDRAGQRAFVACDGSRLVTLDITTGQETDSVEIAGGPDAIWFHPKKDEVYVAIGDPGLLQVLDAEGMVVTDTIETGPGAQTTALDAQRQELFVFVPSSCSTLVFTVGLERAMGIEPT
ncbi:MAG TPA: YncE family protein [Candidatus Dormibacteraeota bacterium]|nr:YncE family protein [Candidatus Dormibacteraeota bacterium]